MLAGLANKLWKDSYLNLATAVVVDPRFKIKLVEFSFIQIDGEQASTFIKSVDDGIHALFQEYDNEELQSRWSELDMYLEEPLYSRCEPFDISN